VCRHLAYLGPPASLSTFLLDAPHALARQAWAPRQMRGSGTVNVDGFGAGWFPGPASYRQSRPVWSDPYLPELARATAAPALLAAVRSASPGMPAGEAACAPFSGEGWLFSLNGRVERWPDSMADLAGKLPVTDLLTMPAGVDSLLLWALLRHRMRAAGPAEAVASVVADVIAAAPGSRLNLLLTDGQQIIATAAGHSLHLRTGGGAALVSSEPLDDDPAWQPVADGTMLVATAVGVAHTEGITV
jgi:glutamine amidotransferase